MDTDDPKSRLGLLPRFSLNPAPSSPAEHSPPATADPAASRRLHPGEGSGSGFLAGPDRPRPADPSPTATSSAGGKPSKAETAALFAGLIGLLVPAAALVVRWRTRRKLRRPSTRQIDDMAAPLARIALRHADLDWLNADLTDMIHTGSALGAYLSDGPLLEGPDIDPGIIPGDFQEEPL
jgi:hypothetical protein